LRLFEVKKGTALKNWKQEPTHAHILFVTPQEHQTYHMTADFIIISTLQSNKRRGQSECTLLEHYLL